MTGKIYIDVRPDGTFASGVFWGDVEQYAATTKPDVASYFTLAPGADGENVKAMLSHWRAAHRIESSQDWRLWAAFCMLQFPGSFFEPVSGEKRRGRLPRPIEEAKAKIISLLEKGETTNGILRNRLRTLTPELIEAALVQLEKSGKAISITRRNPANGHMVTAHRLTASA